MSRKLYVITYGGGAWKAHNAIDRVFTDVGLGDQIELVAFDTASFDQSSIPDSVTTQELGNDRRFGRRAREAAENGSVPYLHGVSTIPGKGAAHIRPNGRAKGEYSIETHLSRLQNVIHEDLKNNEDVSEAIIVPMATLAGGTGSSLSVMGVLVCRELTRRMTDDTDVNACIRIAGLMTVSKLEHGRHIGKVPHGEEHLNTNAALRELRALQGRSQHTPSGEVSLPMSPRDAPGYFTVRPPVLDALFFVQLDETKEAGQRLYDETRDHREGVNFTIAMTLLGLARQQVGGLENMFREDGLFDDEIFTVSFTDVRAPVKQAREFLRSMQARDEKAHALGIDPADFVRLEEVDARVSIGVEELLQRLQADDDPTTVVGPSERITTEDTDRSRELAALLEDVAEQVADDEQLRQLQAESGFITQVLQTDFKAGRVPEVIAKSPLSDAASNALEWIGAVNFGDVSVDDISDREHSLAKNVAPGRGPRDRRKLFRYVFLSMVEAHLSQLIDDHNFWETFESAWSEWEPEASNLVPGLRNKSRMERFEQGVRVAMQNEIADIEAELSNMKKRKVIKRRRLAQDRDQVQEELSELLSLYNSVTELQELATQIRESELPSVRSRVEAVRGKVQSKIDEQRSERRQERLDLRAAQANVEAYREALGTSDTQTVERLSFEVDSLSEAGLEVLDEDGGADNLVELKRHGILDESHIADRLNQVLTDRFEEPMTNYEREGRQRTPTSMLGELTSTDNEAVLNLDPDDAPDVGATRDTEFDTQLPVDGVDRPFSIGFLAIHKGISLADTSELRWINEMRSERRLEQELKGFETTDPDEQVAWPELLVTERDSQDADSRVEPDGGEEY